MIGQVVYQTLSQSESLMALAVGGIHPNRAPLSVEDGHISYNQVSAPREYLSDGGVSSVRTRMDIKCHAPRGADARHYQSAHQMSKAVIAAIRSLHNTPIAGLMVYDANVDTVLDYFEDQIDQHSVLVSVEFHHCTTQ